MIHYANAFQPVTRTPVRYPPPGSVDAQIHVFGNPAIYPLAPGRVYDPSFNATFDRVEKMHRTLGIAHGVIVQPTAYGTDHTLLRACLEQNPAYRGTAIVDDSLSDGALRELHAAGVRGARFNFKSAMGAIPDPAVFERSVERVARLGWHIKIRTTGEELIGYAPLLRHLKVPVVIDHMAHVDCTLGTDQQAVRLIIDCLEKLGWWIMLSNADKHLDPPWEAALPVARAFMAAAPERTLWATDWPHMGFTERTVQNDADLLELIYRMVPDEKTLQAVLVDNPHRLYDFRTDEGA